MTWRDKLLLAAVALVVAGALSLAVCGDESQQGIPSGAIPSRGIQ